ncbi:MAG: hypothetical protein WA705_11100 [Candidatus Ozemobacteraceae bacterium]
MNGKEITSFTEFAKAVREYLAPSWNVPYVAIGFSAILSVLLVYFLFAHVLGGGKKPPRKRSKETQLFDQITQMRGLERFDEEILQELAEVSGIRPLYRILLEKDLFNKALAIYEKRANRPLPNQKPFSKIEYLRRLAKKLFVE